MRFRKKSFLYVKQRMTWQDASDWCKERGATLACTADAEENTFVCQTVQQEDTGLESFWGGGTDHDREGHGRWVDGSP